jgi:y4mF family transcriptional regulator
MTSGHGPPVRTPADLGLVIRERRRALGLDQRGLASRVGVSRQWIVEMEKGKARAGIGLVLRTLSALGLDLGVSAGARDPHPRARPVDAPIDIDAVIDRARGRSPAPHDTVSTGITTGASGRPAHAPRTKRRRKRRAKRR